MLYGRNGVDHYSRFLSTSGCVMLVAGMVLHGVFRAICLVVAIAELAYSTMRVFSRRIDKRRAENIRYLKLRESFLNSRRLRREQWRQRKDYKFFKCPSCKTTLRVPRGKGKIRVVCRRCGNSFQTKT